MADPKYTLYSYFRSSCTARIRIVLNVKGIGYEQVAVNLLKDEHLSEEHRARNPSASVPLLVCGSEDNFLIGQSLAALEYIEEVHPDIPTLPSDPKSRAIVRALANIINADTQPVTNMRIMRRVKAIGGSAEDWNKELMADGLKAYETVAKKYSGKYSFGDTITIADACLLPAYWNAERYKVDLSPYPTINKIVDNLKENPAIVKSHPFSQPDCPDDLRFK
jgi:maleylacetoacetate isomerase